MYPDVLCLLSGVPRCPSCGPARTGPLCALSHSQWVVANQRSQSPLQLDPVRFLQPTETDFLSPHLTLCLSCNSLLLLEVSVVLFLSSPPRLDGGSSVLSRRSGGQQRGSVFSVRS